MHAPATTFHDRPPAPPPRVVVSGIGLVTGLGADRESSWNALRRGRIGVRTLDTPSPPPGEPPWAGCPVPDFPPPQGLAALTSRVAWEAWRDAGLAPQGHDPTRGAVVFGLSKGDPRLLGALCAARFGTDGDRDGSTEWTLAWPNQGARALAEAFDLRGPCLAPVAACATGLIAAIQAADLIRRGVCDFALAGAADLSLDPFLLGAFRRTGVLARVGPGDDPGRAVRPWDRNRSGFLVGEGAAVLVLERDDHARARGVLPYAEFAGGAFGADAYHETALNPDPSNLAGLIGRALASAGVGPSEVDHVNVHGTATASNDPLECRALRRALGRQAGRVACSANKAQIGHLLGAAGAVELALTALAVRDGFVPPTMNLDDPDPLCDLDGTPHVGRPLPIRAALKLSLGFGGHLAAAVLRREDGPRRAPVDFTP